MEANLTLDTVKHYPFKGYNVYLLPKYRKVASGILMGIKDTLTADFEICKEMGGSEDKSEIIKLETIVIGDVNAHPTRWGYDDMNAAGKEIEDLLNSSLLDLTYDASDPPTYIHYNGSGSTPDLLCISTDLSPFTNRIIIVDPGSGHRQIIASIVIQG
ncbi:hypothetical protein CDAR_618821 [Caerostris darwini]|uniref:Endonuclease/exonuclease/phosphatase domain-containing protein n=1 Tax=Caerostris darwini TaxID=1538125 RepID=A0AAV4R103_9ARAC|nr:hypothetical protein CDAR_618821 [Caerostris darwini]